MSLEGTHLGNYQLLRPMGSGGMGEVYLAEDTRIHRQVAIKVIREEVAPYPDANTSKEAARLFQREMKAISQLDHPHILPLFDFGEETVNRTKLTYMVMPFRQEGSLADWLQERGSAQMLSPQEVAHFVSQAADALQHAHDHQLVHQDVKPSNFLMRRRSGHPSHPDLPDLLLADFGIAKFTTATATVSQSIRGTPAYMAPEQWDGQPVAATDQYALAVMAYQLLTGRPLFLGGPGQVMRQHFLAQPQPPSTLNPRIPSALDAVIVRALAKQPEERFASIAEFARAFQQAVQDAPKESPRPSTRGSDIRATLAISLAEALTGTSRTLTLPGGRQVTVPVPGGARDGQVVRLEGLGEASPDGGEAGALILALLVKAAEEAPSLSTASATQAEETLLTAEPTALVTGAPTVRNTGHQPIVSPTAQAEPSIPARTAVSPTEVATPASQGPFPPAPIPLAVGTPLYTYRGHAALVNAVAWSPDGKRIASGSGDRTVQVWDAADGSHVYLYRRHSNTVIAVAWSPDGRRIVSGSGDNTVQVWDAVDGGNVYTYQGHGGTVEAVAWSPDGKRIASGSGDRTVQVWDATTGRNLLTYRGRAGWLWGTLVNAVAWSPDGKRIASVSDDQSAQVWDAITGKKLLTYRGRAGWLTCMRAVAWSPDGRRIASGGDDNMVQIRDANTGKSLLIYRGHTAPVKAVAWSPDGKRIASASEDMTVQIWDATTEESLYFYRDHAAPVNAVAWSPDGTRIASGSDDNSVQVWLARV